MAVLLALTGVAIVGMNMGRDRAAFSQLSWKIVIAAVLTFTTTIIAAATLAELVIDL